MEYSDEFVRVTFIRDELNLGRYSFSTWTSYLGIKTFIINKVSYCTKQDYIKLKNFCELPNVEDIKRNIKESRRLATCIKRYGGDSPMSSDKVRDKIKKTCLQKYGVDNHFKSKEIRDKVHKTLLTRYGVDNIAHISDVKEKKKRTCLEKYGVEYYTQTQEMKDKIAKTKTKKYGNSNYNNREQCKLTCLEKYGVERALQSEEFKERAKRTLVKHYGVEHPLQSNELLRKSHKKWRVSGLSNITFASKEEAYFYIYLKEHGHDIEYQVEYPVPYKDEYGVDHIFIVDFKVDGEYIEIKGNQFFDSDGNPVFIYNKQNPEDNIKRLNLWKSKLSIIKSNDDIEIILSKSFSKGGDYFYMKKYFDEKYIFIKNF